jgi:uncharacterized protein YcbX
MVRNIARPSQTMTARKSIYTPLRQRLLTEAAHSVRLTFAEIEEVLGRKLPPSARKFTSWWSNESSMKAGRTQARAWLDPGFAAKVSLKNLTVEFEREAKPS